MRRFWPVASVLLLMHAVIAWYIRVASVTTGNDDSTYLALARSLRHLSYREEFFVGSPIHSTYPPGYPAALALLSALFGERLDVLLGFGVLCSVAGLALTGDIVRRVWGERLALLFLAVGALNPINSYNAGRIMSEPMYIALASLALWAYVRVRQDDDRGVGRMIWLAAAATIAAALTRSVGIALVAALLGAWLLERRYRAVLVVGAAAALTVGGWFAWSALAPTQIVGRSYVADVTLNRTGGKTSVVGVLAQRVLRNIPDYFTASIPYRLPFPSVAGTALDNALWLVLVVALGAVGLWALWRRRAGLVPLYLLAYFGLLALWPWALGRYMDSIAWVILATLVVGSAVLGERLGARRRWLPSWALALLVVVGAVGQLAVRVQRANACDRADPRSSAGCFSPAQRAYLDAAEYARDAIPRADSVFFVAAKEATWERFSGHRLVPLAFVTKTDSMHTLDYLRSANVGYLVLGQVLNTEKPFGHKLLAICDRLRVVRAFPPRTYIFRVEPDATPEPGGAACRALEPWRTVESLHNARRPVLAPLVDDDQ